MIPYKWKFWRRKKTHEHPQPAELTLNVAITGYDEFMSRLQEMEMAMESFGATCEAAGQKADGIFNKLEMTYNYHLINRPE